MSASSAHPLAADFVRLLRTEAAHYAQVLGLAKEQNAALAAGDHAGLLAVLAEKQRLIARVEALKPDADRLRAQWEGERERVPAAARAEVEAAWDDLVKTLGDVVAEEDVSRRHAVGAQEETGARIATIQRGKAMHRAYGGGPPPPASRFRDQDA